MYPHTQLLLSSSSPSVVISGPHIQTIDSSTGSIISSSASLPAEQEAQKSGPIRCAAINTSRSYLATISDDKMLKVWDITDGTITLSSERELPKKPTSLAFTADSQTILVSDKFGDIFSYSLHPPPPSDPKAASQQQARDRSSLVSHPSTSGTLILGHTSLLTCFLLSHDEKYIITADRDEHIRVSWYPQGYCIEGYCLGSTKFISALHIPASQPSVLISGGGDSEIKVWDWMSGELKYDVPILETVQEFIQVKTKPYQKRRGGGDDDDDGDDDHDRPKANKRRKKFIKRQESSEQDTRNADVHMDDSTAVKDEVTEEEEEVVLAVHKIESVFIKETLCVVFSVVGGTALFTLECPTSENPRPKINALNLHKPVLDFCVIQGETASVWTAVDAAWPYNNENTSSPFVHVAEVFENKLIPISSDPFSTLLATLNSRSLLPGDAANLELYAALKSLPKNTRAEHNAMDRADDIASDGGGQALSKKEIGKLKSKKAIQERQKKSLQADEGV